MILAALDDLMFTSRIRSAAQAVRADVRVAKTTDDLVSAARASNPKLILIDLNARGIDAPAAIARLKADPAVSAIRVVGFVSHVDAAAIAAARSAGIDEVLARSAFVSRLAALLEEAR
jgi:CheY-like chemotaxis protein